MELFTIIYILYLRFGQAWNLAMTEKLSKIVVKAKSVQKRNENNHLTTFTIGSL